MQQNLTREEKRQQKLDVILRNAAKAFMERGYYKKNVHVATVTVSVGIVTDIVQHLKNDHYELADGLTWFNSIK